MASKLLVASALMAVAPTYAAVPADQVKSLPGWSGALLSNMYSGYLNIAGGKHLHYVFVESQNNPATDPVTVWFNGGPGCSSLDGFIYENGPYHIVYGSSPPTLYQNNYTWNNISSMLYIEAPAGVGFSYCDTPDGCSATDDSQAVDNWNALQYFFTNYPEYVNNDLWISGESYAGIYVPTLAYQVYLNNKAGNGTFLNLKGILVGNGCLGDEVGQCGGTNLANYLWVRQLAGHAQISQVNVDAVLTSCGNGSNADSDDCQNALGNAANDVGHVSVYDVYGPCITCDAPMKDGSKSKRSNSRIPVKSSSLLSHLLRGPDACIDACDATNWLSQPSVVQALHVSPNIDWTICSENGTFNYEKTIPDLRTTVYPALTQQAGYRVLIFNGEADACVPYTDNEWWTASMGYNTITPWTSWMVNDNYLGGYYIQYDYNLTFATVREAGHMVPQTQPPSAWVMFNTHLTNAW